MAVSSYLENNKKYFEAYVNGRDSRGRRVQRRKRRIESLRQAEHIEFEFKREIAKLREEAVPFRWHEWFDECMKRMRLGSAKSTVATYYQVVKWVHPHWADKEIQTITKADVYTLIFEKCAAARSDFTRRNILKMVRRLLQMAVEDGHLNRNPSTGVGIRVHEVDQRVLTTQEVEKFLFEAKATHHRFYSIWAFALMTGMRSGEMLALTWADVDFETGLMKVTRQWSSKSGFGPTKSRRTRVVPISETLMSFLKELKLKNEHQDFVLPRLSEWVHGEQARITRDFCNAINITSVKFHDLRATFITNLLANGESLARVMSIVGHSELKTTNGYLRRAGVELKGGTDRLSYDLPQGDSGKVLRLTR